MPNSAAGEKTDKTRAEGEHEHAHSVRITFTHYITSSHDLGN